MSEKPVKECIFCDIIEKNNNILINTETAIVIKDIKPQSKHHYLVISRRHIPDAKHLTKEDEELLLHMVNLGEEILRQNEADLSDTRFGFHWPPFNSVKHLHLHVISPASQMSIFGSIAFFPNTWWFAVPEYVRATLPPKKQ